MAEIGYLLYVLIAALLFMFWRAVGGRSFEALLTRAADEHRRVHHVVEAHPAGGTWREYRAWMRAIAKPTSTERTTEARA